MGASRNPNSSWAQIPNPKTVPPTCHSSLMESICFVISSSAMFAIPTAVLPQEARYKSANKREQAVDRDFKVDFL